MAQTTVEKQQARLERERKARERAEQLAVAIQSAACDVSAQVAATEQVHSIRAHAGVPVRWVPLDGLSSSENQTRLARENPREIEELATSIATHGLLQYPSVRPASAEGPDCFELIAGHRRVEALRLLAARGAEWAGGWEPLRDSLRLVGTRWLIPVTVRTLETLQAFAQTIVENDQRKDTRAWEKVQAYGNFRDAMRESGMPITCEAVAERMGLEWSTIAPYLRVHERLTPEVLEAAGLQSNEMDAKLSALGLSTLRAVVAPERMEDRAAALSRAVEECAPAPADSIRPQTGSTRAPARKGASGAAGRVAARGFQVNIRIPLDKVKPARAAHYAVQIAPVLRVLIERAADGGLSDSDIVEVRDQVEAAAKALRRF